MKIGIVGVGYVGLPSAVGFASFGHEVVCVDVDEGKISQLRDGKLPIYEKGLDELFEKNKSNILFTTRYTELLNVDFIIIAVGTPQSETGEANLSYLFEVAEKLQIEDNQIIAIKSTVPVGTNNIVKDIISKNNPDTKFEMLSMPEFLREGFAIHDFLNPDRIVVGSTNSQKVRSKINQLYPVSYHNKIFYTDIKSAELIKYASNAFLATKIHYINEIANLCEKVGANIDAVSFGMGLDSRIGMKFLNAGVGFGGSCFPKDTVALNYLADQHGVELSIVKDVIEGNKNRKIQLAQRIVKILEKIEHPTITFMGIAFKGGTDDCRESSAIAMIEYIQQHKKNATIRCYDKLAINNAKKILKNVEFYEDMLQSVEHTDLIIVMNEDEEFINLSLLNIPIFDFRGIMPYKPHIFKIGVNNFDA